MSPKATLAGFVLEERIGVGGMAEVFRAQRHGPGGFAKQVAIKRVLPDLSGDPRFIDMFLEEARLAARFSSRNLVEVFDFGEASGTYYLVMEYVDGVDLAALLATGKLDVDHAAHLGIELCEGLDHLHRATDDDGRPLAVVHRDVSPGNVLLSTAGEIKLGDFGIARDRARSLRTADGAIKGKLAYLSPEQVRNDEVDVRTDIYGLGLCLFEALAQRRYLDADDELALLRLAAEPPVELIAELDVAPVVISTLTRALDPEPARRYPSAQLFADELRRWSADYQPRELSRALAARVAGCKAGAGASHEPKPGRAGGDAAAIAGEREEGGANTEVRDVLAARDSRRLALPVALALVLLGALTWWLWPEPEPQSPPPQPAAPVVASPADAAPATASDARLPEPPPDGAPHPTRADARASTAKPRRVAVPADAAPAAPSLAPPDARRAAPDPDHARARELLQGIDRRFKAKGLTSHDVPGLSTERAWLAAAIARGETPITELDAVAAAVDKITIDRHFIDAKLQRLSRKMKRLELDQPTSRALRAHSQRALSHSVNGSYALANRELNEIASVVEP